MKWEVLKLGRKHNLSIACLLSLFDKTAKPILLYGGDILVFRNNDILENVHLKCWKGFNYIISQTDFKFEEYFEVLDENKFIFIYVTLELLIMNCQ